MGVERHKTITSTNDRAKQLAAENAEAGTWVVAEHQTQGRGQRGRSWHSPAGAGLYASLILRQELEPRFAPLITIASAVALADAIADQGVELGIKWPNDLLAQDSLRKVAGILVEITSDSRQILSAVIGFGVNLKSQQWPAGIADYATSLEALGATQIDSDAMLQQFEHNLRFDDAVERWRERAIGVGTQVELQDGAKLIRGRMDGVTTTGALLIDGKAYATGQLNLSGAPRPPA